MKFTNDETERQLKTTGDDLHVWIEKQAYRLAQGGGGYELEYGLKEEIIDFAMELTKYVLTEFIRHQQFDLENSLRRFTKAINVIPTLLWWRGSLSHSKNLTVKINYRSLHFLTTRNSELTCQRTMEFNT